MSAGKAESSWRDDPHWVLVDHDPDFFGDAAPPARPPAAAELAQPDLWASLYDGHRLVAIWSRRRGSAPPSAPAATIAV